MPSRYYTCLLFGHMVMGFLVLWSKIWSSGFLFIRYSGFGPWTQFALPICLHLCFVSVFIYLLVFLSLSIRSIYIQSICLSVCFSAVANFDIHIWSRFKACCCCTTYINFWVQKCSIKFLQETWAFLPYLLLQLKVSIRALKNLGLS